MSEKEKNKIIDELQKKLADLESKMDALSEQVDGKPAEDAEEPSEEPAGKEDSKKDEGKKNPAEGVLRELLAEKIDSKVLGGMSFDELVVAGKLVKGIKAAGGQLNPVSDKNDAKKKPTYTESLLAPEVD